MKSKKDLTILKSIGTFTFSKRLIISLFKSFWGFSGAELGVTEGESLNKSSIPEVDWGVLSTDFTASVFLDVEVSAAAATITSTKLT